MIPLVSLRRSRRAKSHVASRSTRLSVEGLEERCVPASLPLGFSEEIVASGLSSPTAMTVAPDGRIFVAEQTGNVRVIQNGQLLSTPFATLAVDPSGERGLLGVALDKDFNTSHFVFVYYTITANGASHNRVSRFVANGNVAQAGSEFVIADLDPLTSATNHNGGAIHVGKDGKLYVAVGDNANGLNSQSLTSRLGKILRYNLDGSIPSDNPTTFAGITGTPTFANRAIWAVGLRNPYTFAVQPYSGRLFINDVGQSAFEEINDGLAGANYGWPSAEGPSSNPNFTNPLFSYGHGAGTSLGFAITGGAFYNPDTQQFPSDYVGDYFFADFVNNWIRRFDPATGTATLFASNTAGGPVDLQTDGSGNLLYLTRGSGVATGAVTAVHYTATEQRAVVAAFYRDFLERPGAASEIDYWAPRVTTFGQQAIADAIARSPESLGHIVDGVYVKILGRLSDSSGRSFWTNQMSAGQSIEQVIAAFSATAEYSNRAIAVEQTPDSDTAFVRSLYRNLLGRTNETTAEVHSWLALLPSVGRDGVTLRFANSNEFRTNSINALYGPFAPPPYLKTLLKRTNPASAGEVNSWVATGANLLAIEIFFAGSAEYRNNS